jgi:DNA-binding NarL/FixJ family response regulator
MDLSPLADQERQVLRLVVAGHSNDEIAGELVMRPATAKTHVSRILAKLDVRDRAQLVVRAYESDLVRPGWLGR